MLAYEDTDVAVTMPAVPRVGDRILRDDGKTPPPEFVVTQVQWYWDMTEQTDVQLWVFVDEAP